MQSSFVGLLPVYKRIYNWWLPYPSIRIVRMFLVAITFLGRKAYKYIHTYTIHMYVCIHTPCATLSSSAYQCFFSAQIATPCNDTLIHNANILHDRNNDTYWISVRKLTDYPFVTYRTASSKLRLLIYFRYITTDVFLSLYDRFNHIIVRFLNICSKTCYNGDCRWNNKWKTFTCEQRQRRTAQYVHAVIYS